MKGCCDVCGEFREELVVVCPECYPPPEMLEQLNLREWTRQQREEIAACRLALEEARPLVKLIATAQPNRGHEAALDLIEAALNWRTTAHVEGAGPGGGPPAAGPASHAPDKPGTGDPLWPGPGPSPGKPGRAGAPGADEQDGPGYA